MHTYSHIYTHHAPYTHTYPRIYAGTGMGQVGVWGIRAWISTQMGKIKC